MENTNDGEPLDGNGQTMREASQIQLEHMIRESQKASDPESEEEFEEETDDEEIDITPAPLPHLLVRPGQNGRVEEESGDEDSWDPSVLAPEDKFYHEAALISKNAIWQDHENINEGYTTQMSQDAHETSLRMSRQLTEVRGQPRGEEASNSTHTQMYNPHGKIVGEWTTKIWDINTVEISRNPAQSHTRIEAAENTVVYPVLARCCLAIGSKGKAPHSKLEARLSLSDSGSIPQVFVGLSALLLEDAYVKSNDSGEQNTASDNLQGLIARTEPSGQQCHNNIIYHENALVPGNMSFIKKALHNQLGTKSQRHFIAKWKREAKSAVGEVNPSPVAKVRVSETVEDRKPVWGSVYESAQFDTFYKLRYPTIALFELPKEMVRVIEEFLERFSRDPMPLNTALAAAIIFSDLHRNGRPVESFVSKKSTRESSQQKFNNVSMAVFILYFPHLLRFTEVRRLTRYVHPLRWAAVQYERDTARSADYHVPQGALDEAKVIELIGKIRGRKGVNPDHRLHLIPQCMPGSTMAWPEASTGCQQKSKNTTIMCLINDIRTLGLPCYHRRAGWEQLVGAPLRLSVHWLRQRDQNRCLNKFPDKVYWWPEFGSIVSSLTGPAKLIGPVFSATEGVNMSDDPMMEGDFMTPKPVPYHELFSISLKKDITSLNKRVLRMAKANGKASKLQWDEDAMLLTYEGFNADWEEAQASGVLNDILNMKGFPDPPTPPMAKRRKIDENSEMEDIRQLPGFDIRQYAVSKEDRDKCQEEIARMAPKAIQWGVIEMLLRGEECARRPILMVLREIKADVTQPLQTGIDENSSVAEIQKMVVNFFVAMGIVKPHNAPDVHLQNEWTTMWKPLACQVAPGFISENLEMCVVLLGSVSENLAVKGVVIERLMALAKEKAFSDQIEFVDRWISHWEIEEQTGC
ncbi:hypothetical protein FGLOB1_14053 [Fusarium globosum]|uniref:Uncharacterized protein n=1 Tax=Fusarium globosum TaxID=78864 RepID=A0A8H5XK38_9HYPO|nr:hypothetical protein FGLOB1_14053 [Fusarium globosum]